MGRAFLMQIKGCPQLYKQLKEQWPNKKNRKKWN